MRGGRDALRLPHRLPVAVPARVVRALDAGVVAVPPLVTQRHLGASADRAARGSREADGRAETTPSMVVIDTHLARGASNGGFTFHDRGGPYGRTKGAKRIVAVDVTGLPVGALVVPASTHENRDDRADVGAPHRAGRRRPAGAGPGRSWRHRGRRPTRWAAATTSRCAGSGGTTSSRCSAPSGTPGASRSPTDASAAPADWRSRSRTPPPRRPAGSRSPASRPSCATCRVLRLPGAHSQPQRDRAECAR